MTQIKAEKIIQQAILAVSKYEEESEYLNEEKRSEENWESKAKYDENDEYIF